MYIPPKFKVDDTEIIRSFIEQHPFGLLLSINEDQIQDTHTPFVVSEDGELLGHIARANPQWKGWGEGSRVKVIFTGPHAYVSPQYYVAEFTVPTWNYTAVSVSGRINILEQDEEVLQFLDRLVAASETSEKPWTLDRTDERYMKLLSGIVVFSVSMDNVEASFKMNQNKSEEDQRKVVESLTATGCPYDRDVAGIMSRNLKKGSHRFKVEENI